MSSIERFFIKSFYYDAIGFNPLQSFISGNRVIMMGGKDQTIRILPTETYFAMVRRMLSESGRAYVRITGTSMLPLLHHLRDGVIIESLYGQASKKDIHSKPKPPAPVDPGIIINQSIKSDGTSLSDISASTLHTKSDGIPFSDVSVFTQQLNNTPNTTNEIDPNTVSDAGLFRQDKTGSKKSPLK